MFKPKEFQDLHPKFRVSLFNALSIPESKTYHQGKDDPKWIEATNKEISILEANDTWKVIELPKVRELLALNEFYKINFKPDGTSKGCKVHFVVRGFDQVKDKDFKHTFSLIAKLLTVKILNVLATQKDWPFHQLDINNAFSYGFLDKEVF